MKHQLALSLTNLHQIVSFPLTSITKIYFLFCLKPQKLKALHSLHPSQQKLALSAVCITTFKCLIINWFSSEYSFYPTYIIQTWLVQYFRLLHQWFYKKKSRKNRTPICCINRLSSSEHKTSSVILAWHGDRLLLELIEWRSPSVRRREALQGHLCSSSPKASVASVLFNLFFTNPQKGQGREKSDKRSPNCWGHWAAWLTVWPVHACVCVWVCEKVPRFTTTPHPHCTAGLCNGGGRGVTICQEVCADGRGLYSGHYQRLDIRPLIIIQVYWKPGDTHTQSTLHTCRVLYTPI